MEARTLEDVRTALSLGVERILLDNMSVEMMAEAVRLTGGRAKLEASGNVTLDTVRGIAETGVDYISIGALTHSAKVFDVSFDYLNSQSRRMRPGSKYLRRCEHPSLYTQKGKEWIQKFKRCTTKCVSNSKRSSRTWNCASKPRSPWRSTP